MVIIGNLLSLRNMEFINTYAVDVFTLDGQFVNNWSSKMDAARALNIKNNLLAELI